MLRLLQRLRRLPRLGRLGRVALPLAALALCVSGAAPSVAASADGPRIYRWIDADGIAHYTTDPERIPAALRERLPERASKSDEGAFEARPRSVDVWAERDRPPDTSEAQGIGGSDLGVDDPARRARIEEIGDRIDQLRTHIATDEEALKQRVVGAGADPMSSGDDEELRIIAARLPGLLSELRELRDERASLEAR